MHSNSLSVVSVVCLFVVSSIPCFAQSTQNQQQPQQYNTQGQLTNQQDPNAIQSQGAVQAQGLIPPQQAASPMVPEWYTKMGPKHRQFLDELLTHWQSKSSDVKRYKCEFTRFEYDTSLCNWRDPSNNQLAAAAIMQGEIRFASPDQACYETSAIFDFELNDKKEPDYKQRSDISAKEKWICDGKAIHEFDFVNKKLYETKIPPEMQGKGLMNSPIPFLFGASREDILNRFWVRVTTPEGVDNEYWLEAVPKRIEDARNYKKIDLVLSRDELFLPIMLHIYAPNYNPKKNNMTSRVFEFKNRQKNSKLAKIQSFFRWFVRPATPPGFERVERKSLQARQQFDRSRLQRPAQNAGTGTQIK